MLVAPDTTWLLVRTSPDAVSTMPVPAASPPLNPSRVVMSTTPGSTLAAIVDVSAFVPGVEGVAEPSMTGMVAPFSVDVRPTATPTAATSTTARLTARTRRGLLRGAVCAGTQTAWPPHCPGGVHCPPAFHGG